MTLTFEAFYAAPEKAERFNTHPTAATVPLRTQRSNFWPCALRLAAGALGMSMRRRLRRMPDPDANRCETPGALRIPEAHLRLQSPNGQVATPWVFDLNHRHAVVPWILYLNRYALEHCALEQAFAPRVFHFNYPAPEHAVAPGIFHRNCHDPAPRVFHLNHPAIGRAPAPEHFFSELRSGWHGLRDADCSMLDTSPWLRSKLAIPGYPRAFRICTCARNLLSVLLYRRSSATMCSACTKHRSEAALRNGENGWLLRIVVKQLIEQDDIEQ